MASKLTAAAAGHARRQAVVRAAMAEAGLDAMVVSHLPNIRYLTGFSGSNGLLLLTERGTWLFTDGRYREQAAGEVQAAKTVIPPKGDLWGAVGRQAAKAARLGLEFEHVTLGQRERLRRSYSGKVAASGGWIEAQRSCKEPEEIEAIRRAVRLASSVFEPTVGRLRPGMAETALAGHLEFALRQAGGEGLAFETIIASGERGARVHAHPTGETIAAQGFVVMDYGVILGGYVSDMTRTVHVGRPSRRAREVYGLVLEAQLAAIAAVRAGARAASVDRAARRVIEGARMGKYFPHSTGHGVGLEIHEAPRLAATSKDVLAAGQVITVEPGVYIPGWGGVRIEDVILVTSQGAEVLTPTPKELLAVE